MSWHLQPHIHERQSGSSVKTSGSVSHYKEEYSCADKAEDPQGDTDEHQDLSSAGLAVRTRVVSGRHRMAGLETDHPTRIMGDERII